jgi:2-keto-3-deoxy-L-rhamnonate aldolase RhmA
LTLTENRTLERLRRGEMALGLGIQALRGSVVPMLARTAGYDWLFLDLEHGAMTLDQASQIAMAALAAGVTPIVRVCADALHEATRALDNGAQGIVVPHVDTAAQAAAVVQALRYPPQGSRSWGGSFPQYGLTPAPAVEAQAALNRETAIIAMIETPEAVANVDSIAAVEGLDVLLIGTQDLTTCMGIPGQIGHARVRAAYEAVAAACQKHGRVLGMGGIYDREWAAAYMKLGARFVLGGADSGLLLAAAGERARFLRALAG